jgi:hypothetical protein
MSVDQPTNLNKCCVLGFHGATGTPIQIYSPIDFGPTVHDNSIAAHEVGEWIDDPFVGGMAVRFVVNDFSFEQAA